MALEKQQVQEGHWPLFFLLKAKDKTSMEKMSSLDQEEKDTVITSDRELRLREICTNFVKITLTFFSPSIHFSYYPQWTLFVQPSI